jgi:hypothetical protein
MNSIVEEEETYSDEENKDDKFENIIEEDS